jgi:trimeric autotransporter adhesin
MVATGTYNDASTKNLTDSTTWTSGDDSVATVSSTGLVTAVSSGTASITATSGRISGATTVSVTLANLKSIEVTPTTVSITSGETQDFVATATLEDGSSVVITADVTWTSSNTSTATIASSGVAPGQSLTSSAST